MVIATAPIRNIPAPVNKVVGTPYPAIKRPPPRLPRAPTARAPVDCTATALMDIFLGTISVISPWVEGVSKDMPTPLNAIRTNTGHICPVSVQATAPSRISMTALYSAVAASRRLRGIRSLRSPAIGAERLAGAFCIANDAAVRKTESVSTSTSHPAASRSH